MGIDITEIAQKVLDNNKNAANVFRKMYDLHFNPSPIDVPFEYIDENGNKVTTTIKNVARFRRKVWDDVGGALGQFSRTFYVDAVNGDDNNEGTADAPFKTIKKAVYATPISGACDILLIGDYVLKASENRTNVSGGRKIRIFGAETGSEKLILEYDTQVCFALYTKSMLTLALDIEVKQTTGENLIKNIIFHDDESIFQILKNKRSTFNQGSTVNSKVSFVSDYVSLAYCRRSTSSYMNVDVDTGGNNIALMQVGFTSRLNVAFSSIDGNNADATNVKPLVSGIIFDSDSGNPINLLCNLNLSN